MVKEKRLPPRSHSPAREDEDWLAIRLEDPSAEVARLIAVELKKAINGRPLRSVAQDAGLTHPALLKILGGKAYPNVDTIVRLEQALQVHLWPNRY